MSIDSLTNLLNCAKTRNNYVVGFVVQGWEDASSFVRAADETEIDIILQSGPGLRKNMPLELIYAMFEKLSGETNIKIVPHLDHGENYDICKKALDIGFTSIMYDGSKLSFKENLNQSLKIYELTQKYNACLEVELGFVGYNDISKNKKTSPEEVKLFTDQLPVTAMAVSVGNTHLQNENSAIIDYDLLREISEITSVPLVIHGGSGVSPIDRIKMSKYYGVRKFNIGTEFRRLFGTILRDILINDKHIFDRLEIMQKLKSALTKKAKKILLDTNFK